jgi:hypothetical protein
MVNKNKTIINNKNIIQICGTTKHKSQKHKSQSKKDESTNINIGYPSVRSINNFPNSSSLEKPPLRFAQAMRDLNFN